MKNLLELNKNWYNKCYVFFLKIYSDIVKLLNNLYLGILYILVMYIYIYITNLILICLYKKIGT